MKPTRGAATPSALEEFLPPAPSVPSSGKLPQCVLTPFFLSPLGSVVSYSLRVLCEKLSSLSRRFRMEKRERQPSFRPLVLRGPHLAFAS